ncbi:MAG: NAD(P)-dependent oxidoreductase [Acidobacteriota bacterium]|nr:NAD(P)-dependent oxidoreductase [Acidobacteriota bacterium]
MTQRVAILGLGTMGMGMARNLLKAGFSVAAFNRTHAKGAPLAAAGARIAGTPAEAASDADVVISMLSDDDASRSAWTGEQGALAGARPGAVLVESSTVTPAWIAELAGLAAARGLSLLDAPVTGSRVQAEGGQLNFLVGGDAAVLERARPVLAAMSKEIVHLGPVGSGARMKLINNFLCGVQVASLAEGMAWIERSGLDREQALKVLCNGAPGSPLLNALSARMAAASYDVNFLLSLMRKDLSYAGADAATLGVELRTAKSAEERFVEAAAAGYADKDMSAVIEPLRARQS